MMNYPTNNDDVIDSRDVIEAIADMDPETKEEQAWRDSLEMLAKQGEDYSEDWQYGATLVRDSYFQDYAQELCEDIGEIPKDFPDYIRIDWEATAQNILQDYTAVDFDGVTYWIR